MLTLKTPRSPYVSGPNSVKVATPLQDLEAQNIKIDKAYLVSCTNSRASDLAAAAKVFKDASKAAGTTAKISDGVKFYIAAASLPEQQAAEGAGDWQAMLDAGAIALPAGCGPCIGLGAGLLEPGETGISASNRNFKGGWKSRIQAVTTLLIESWSGRMGSTAAKAYLASPEAVASSALKGIISGPGWFDHRGSMGVIMGEGDGIKEEDRMITAEEGFEKIIGQLDGIIKTAEKNLAPQSENGQDEGGLTDILPGFPDMISGEVVFCDADNIK